MDSHRLREIIWKAKEVFGRYGEKDLRCTFFDWGTIAPIKAKDKLIRQINSFKILSDRYKALSEHDEMIDIMAEAEKLRNLTKLTN
jgi:hypothetical protein